MPPRLSLLNICGSLVWSPTPTAPFLAPALLQAQQQRAASILSSLSDNPGAYNKRIRRGRGPSSGKGKTSGRGHKGQKQHGKVPAGFNGGQTPIEVVHGKRGFDNQFSVEMSPLNVDRLQSWIDQGRIDPSRPITMKELNDSRCLHGVEDGVKLLARGADQMRTPVNIIVSRASAAAIAAIEGAGGTVTTRYYTPFSIRRVLRGLTDPGTVTTRYYKPFTIRRLAWPFTDPDTAPQSVSAGDTVTPEDTVQPRNRFALRLPDPTSRKDIEYYRDPAHRGYLSHLVQEGEGPSLFFRKPGSGKTKQRVSAKGKKSSAKAENRIW